MDFRFNIILEYAPFFFKGVLWTVGLSLVGIFFGTILGLAIGLGKMVQNRLVRLPFDWYVHFFRGTPLFVQILLIHFGVMPMFTVQPNPLVSGAISLSLNAAAYIAEIFRAGIQSIDRGQMEAARSLGMTHVQAMRYIILPQAIKRMIPPLGNEFIVLIKDSSLAAIIAAPELMYWGRAMQGQYYRVWEPYLTVALIYLLLTLSLSKLLHRLERRYDA
ncbi:amino acid ABC transporter permease [Anoxybacillus suryakundensis]|uniref:Amine acid ABC transporter, permease protein, 3-TM region, His/Glu/Gln/Arg/opine family n=1 Tax=Anoxybacillus suryakundensis TaxID=1325335 RepID=A0A0K6GMG3_9BACL|nr:amino acid ABC transporter permease [Anoxybacillus suryakundensis]CUA79738.1 amine acid ABC transporter, permease protein, 3-TM region, His/Glu/Gln/Arg/opine family [Anoxybacillus suryakundensis]